MASTIKPSGLAVVRDGALKYACSWKIADKDYGKGHQFRWRVWTTAKKSTKWTNVTMGAAATTKTITVTAANYAPNSGKPNVYAFEFAVRGMRNPTTKDGKTTNYDWSAWASKKWTMKVPNKPTVTATLTATNETTFAWTNERQDDDDKPFTSFRYQTFVMKECKELDGSKLNWYSSNGGWADVTISSNSSVAKTEDSSALAYDSYTRWFRIRAQGPAGNTGWVYSKHVYARPKKATIKGVNTKEVSGNTNILMTWAASTNAAYPIDETIAQYSFSVPGAGQTFPTGETWTDAMSVKDTPGTDSANFTISDTLGVDECLFVRATTVHDSNSTPGNWKLAASGNLVTPSDLSVSLDSNFKASISVDNDSNVPDACVAIVHRNTDGKEITVAVTTAGPGTKTLTNIQCPSSESRAKFYAYAFQGTYTQKTRSDGVSSYSIKDNMTSGRVFDSASAPDVPVQPNNVTATASGNDTILDWDWSWSAANQAEVTWSTDKNAWSSTTQPSRYLIDSKWTHKWRIAGAGPGSVWYFRVRLINTKAEDTIYGPWSDLVSLDRTAAPNQPILSLSKAVVRPGGEVKASWTYECDDGIKQGAAEVWRVTGVVDGTPTTFVSRCANATTGKSAKWTCDSTWTSGQTHYVCARVTSKTGKISAWSDAIPFYIGNKLTCTISQISTNTITITDSDSNTRSVDALTELPMTVTVTGAGAGGTTTVVIDRLTDYHIDRPDGSVRDGYEGETIAIHRQTGEAQITINREDLIGIFDDGAAYKLTAMIEDGNGQSAEASTTFEVHWDHQPEVPSASVVVVDGVAKISTTAPQSVAVGDGVDIYRLSADNPQLIVQGGAFGTDYVDPFPALGEHGGYRVVAVSKYGDYITAGDQEAWTDLTINLSDRVGYIHFNGETLPLDFDVSLSNTWTKDFKETQYLGGSVRGDWNTAVSRSGSFTVTVLPEEVERIQAFRRLADYAGICHIRTQDGSSYAADVQVSSNVMLGGNQESFTLNITRIDPQELDGIPYSEWVTT